MNCKQICEEFVFRYVDDEMEKELRIRFRQHVADCPECAQRAQHTRTFVTFVRQRVERCRCAAPIDLRERLVNALPHRRGSLV